MTNISWEEIKILCDKSSTIINFNKYDSYYGVPKNGLYIAEELKKIIDKPIVWNPDKNTLVVDDLIESGETISKYPDNDCLVLYQKGESCKLKDNVVSVCKISSGEWIQFPWESEIDIESCITRQLEYLGEDPNREGLKDTPKRIRKSWNKIYGGYRENPADILKRRFTPESKYPTPIILKDIEFYSTCEHHLLPFFGKISIAYIPDKEIVGISKLARLVECFARRMQIQERLTEDIANSIFEYLHPLGVFILCEAQHFCMVARGVEKKKGVMVTSSYRGEERYNDLILRLFDR